MLDEIKTRNKSSKKAPKPAHKIGLPEPVEIGTFRGIIYLLPFAILFWIGIMLWIWH